jgi:hypothetical protein
MSGGSAASSAQLRLVDDHDELLGAHLHHLLAQQRAAAALDQVEVRVDLVGAVDGHVQVRVFVERGQRDAEPLGLIMCAGRKV